MSRACPRYLVSFCNTVTPGLVLGVYEVLDRRFAWIDLPVKGPTMFGATGLCWADAHVLVGIQYTGTGTSGIAALDGELRLIHYKVLHQVRDIHSIVWGGDAVLIADSSTNGLWRVLFDPTHGFGEEREFWRYIRDGQDSVHVNTVACCGEDIFVSLFGPKKESWAESFDGAILNVSRHATVLRDVSHPHSLVADGGALYFLESQRGLLHRVTPSGDHCVLASVPGYVRGLARYGDGFVVGCSGLRRRSRSSGTLNALPSQAARTSQFHSWIFIIGPSGDVIRQDLMTPFGSEIYDILSLQRAADCCLLDDATPQAIARRVWAFEDRLDALAKEHETREIELQRQLVAAEAALCEREARETELRGQLEMAEAVLGERDTCWTQERIELQANLDAERGARDRAEVTLKRALQSRRYRIANLFAISWWLAVHPGYVAARTRHEARQWLRAILGLAVKRWLKRAS